MINIIMPIHNGSAYLDKALGSIALQSLPREEFNVTLVNDAGDETYEEYIARWSRFIDIEEIYLMNNVGPGIARQIGIENTEGEYIVFMDSDDMFMHPDALKIMIATMETKECDLVVTNAWCESTYSPLNENLIWLHGKCYRRKFLEEKKIKFCPCREASFGSEDIPVNEMIKLLGGNIIYLDSLTYYWRHNESSLTHTGDFEIAKFRANIINRIWLYHNVALVDKPKAIEYVLGLICQCYHSYNAWLYEGRGGDEQFDTIKMAYEDTIAKEDLSMSDFEEAYTKCSKGCITFETPPILNFYEYLERLGVYKQVYMSEDEFDQSIKEFEERVSEMSQLPTEVEQTDTDNGEKE